MSGAAAESRRNIFIGVAMVAATALVLRWIGHPWICTCGSVKLWLGARDTAENSQHLTDWYTPSHIIHGFLFYFILWMVLPRVSRGRRALIALAVEAGWEIIENTPWIMDRYRESTVSLSYFGDSIINSLSDITAMLVGFYIASRLPWQVTLGLAIAMELIVGAIIRDNLTLNVIMLLHPVEAIRIWQAGG